MVEFNNANLTICNTFEFIDHIIHFAWVNTIFFAIFNSKIKYIKLTLEYDGYIYSQDMIRNMMLNKMMPEELDDAIRRWKEHGETSVEQLYHHLFLTVVLANALELFHKVMRCESIPIECEVKVKVVA